MVQGPRSDRENSLDFGKMPQRKIFGRIQIQNLKNQNKEHEFFESTLEID